MAEFSKRQHVTQPTSTANTTHTTTTNTNTTTSAAAAAIVTTDTITAPSGNDALDVTIMDL